MKKLPKITKKCEVCKKEIIRPINISQKRFKKVRYCSSKCWGKIHSQQMKGRPSKNKGKPNLELKQRWTNPEFRDKMTKFGKDNPCWKGENITTVGFRRRAQKHRKDHCKQCNSKNNLDTHHKDGDITNNNPENLITLCRACHFSIDRRYEQPKWRANLKKHTFKKQGKNIGGEKNGLVSIRSTSRGRTSSELYLRFGGVLQSKGKKRHNLQHVEMAEDYNNGCIATSISGSAFAIRRISPTGF